MKNDFFSHDLVNWSIHWSWMTNIIWLTDFLTNWHTGWPIDHHTVSELADLLNDWFTTLLPTGDFFQRVFWPVRPYNRITNPLIAGICKGINRKINIQAYILENAFFFYQFVVASAVVWPLLSQPMDRFSPSLFRSAREAWFSAPICAIFWAYAAACWLISALSFISGTPCLLRYSLCLLNACSSSNP